MKSTLKVLTVDTPNLNGRMYPREEMEKAIAKFNDRDEHHPLFGQLGYSSDFDNTTISLDRVSHTVDKIFMDGDDVMAEISVKETPMGNVLKTLLSEVPDEVKLGARGIGMVDTDGNVGDYNLITIDVIPSTD